MKTQSYLSLSWRIDFTIGCVAAIVFLYGQIAIGEEVATDQSSKHHLDAGLEAFQQGNFIQAVQDWQEASEISARAGKLGQQTDALIRLADAYQALGQYRRSLQRLQQARELADKIGNKLMLAGIRGSLGQAYFLLGAPDEAKTHLDASIALARDIGDSDVLAASLNTLGNLLTSAKRYSEAGEAYSKSIDLAQQAGNTTLAAKASVNAARATLQTRRYDQAESMLEAALNQAQKLEVSHSKAYTLVALGQLAHDLYKSAANTERLSQAYQVLKQAADIADELADHRVTSYAWGYLGQLYEQQRRYTDALRLTRRAAFAAQQANAPESLYRWQWQIGRLLKAQGDIEGAIAAYRESVLSLQSIGNALYYDQPSSGLAVEPVFFELAELLLQRSPQITDPKVKRGYLVEARDTLEQLKTAELTNYFRDDCAIALQSRTVRVDRPGPKTAIIYPIVLPDRTELLLSLSGGIQQFTLPLDRQVLTQAVRDFRTTLENRTTREYLPYAQQLYRWLIGPMAAELANQNIDTLVFVPDDPLRTVPIAALHDGESFLIDKYIVATTPGLTLTDFRPIRRHRAQMMLNGLTEGVQGFPPLRHVSDELDTIQELYGGTRLQDKEFLISNVQQELATTPYSIVHIASHGQFASDVNNSFLLTFDDKMTMDRLEQLMGLSQYREQPVELLTLSACQTAAGDDRAALGLAGIAVKAGARSVLATLWVINDQAASLLISQFYRRLQEGNLSKAEALQQAQLSLLSDRRYQHPYYWSPFLLIGNWL